MKTQKNTSVQTLQTHRKPKTKTLRLIPQSQGDSITSEKAVNYRAKLTRISDGINTKPWGTEGYQIIRLVNDWVGKEVKVTKEAVTPRATWSYIEVLGTDIAGWIDKAGLNIESIISEKTAHYHATLSRSNDGINTRPWEQKVINLSELLESGLDVK